MRHGSLFSGIGGFDLAAEWMEWENVFHCEWMPFPRKVLKYYWPKAISYENICTTDFTIHRGKIDILTGGFPCQPYSTAGKRLGKEDDRHLWPEMLRAIREVKPSWVVGENVYGLVNWNGGLVFHEVQSDLEAEGYEVWPFVLPAVSVNAPHRRDRIWFVAYCNSNGFNQCNSNNEINTSEGRVNAFSNISKSNDNGNATNSKCQRLQRPSTSRKISGKENEMGRKWNQSTIRASSIHTESNASDTNGIGLRGQSNRFGKSGFVGKNKQGNYWENFPTQSPVCNGDDGLSSRLDSITFSKWRNESIKGGGNAIVPQVAYQIFKTINKIEKNEKSNKF